MTLDNGPITTLEIKTPGTRVMYRQGEITTNEDWSGTVYVGANVTVRMGATVTVQPGTTIIMNASQRETKVPGFDLAWPFIFVEGDLIAEGTSGAPISIESDNYVLNDRANSDLYNSIWFLDGSDPPTFKYCNFSFGAGCIRSNESLIVENCHFNEYDNAIICHDGMDLTIKNCTFATNDTVSAGVWAMNGGEMDFSDVKYIGTDDLFFIENSRNINMRRIDSKGSGYALYAYNCESLNLTDSHIKSGSSTSIYMDDCWGRGHVWDVTLNNTSGWGLNLDLDGPVNVHDVDWEQADDLVKVYNSEDIDVTRLNWQGDCAYGVSVDSWYGDVGPVDIWDLNGNFTSRLIDINDADSVNVNNVDAKVSGTYSYSAFQITGSGNVDINNCSITNINSGLEITQDKDDIPRSIKINDVDLHTHGTTGDMITLSYAKNAIVQNCLLDSSLPTAFDLDYLNEFTYGENEWSVECKDGFEIFKCGKVHIQDIETDYTGTFIDADDSGDLYLSYLEINGSEDSSGSIDVEDTNALVLHNSTITAEGGTGIIADFYYQTNPMNYVNISDVEVNITGDGYTDYAINIESQVSALIKDSTFHTKETRVGNFISQGSVVLSNCDFLTHNPDKSVVYLEGDADFVLKDIEINAEFNPLLLELENEGSLTAEVLDLVGGDGAKGINDGGLGTNVYNHLDLTGNFTECIRFEAGGKTLNDVYIPVGDDGVGIYLTNSNMDALTPHTVLLQNIEIEGGLNGIKFVDGSSDINMEITTQNVSINGSESPIVLDNAKASINEVFITGPTIDSDAAILITEGDVSITRSIIRDYFTGIDASDDAKLTVQYVDLYSTTIGVFLDQVNTASLKDMNIIWSTIGITSEKDVTVENVFFGHLEDLYYGDISTDLDYDIASTITVTQLADGPVDITGIDQDPFNMLYYWGYYTDSDGTWLTGEVTFTVYLGDPDIGNDIDFAGYRFYPYNETAPVWIEPDISDVDNFMSFTQVYDSRDWADGTVMRFDLKFDLEDGTGRDIYYTFSIWQGGSSSDDDDYVDDDYVDDDDTTDYGYYGDGGAYTDAPETFDEARPISTDQYYTWNGIIDEFDIDWYKFEVRDLKTFTVTISDSNGVSAEVYNSDEESIGDATNFGTIITFDDPPDDVYYIKVIGTEGSFYDLEITVETTTPVEVRDGGVAGDAPGEESASRPISVGTHRSCSLFNETDIDWYSYQASGLKSLTITISESEFAQVAMFDKNNNPVGEMGIGNTTVTLKPVENGMYYFRVTGTAKSQYTLKLSVETKDTGDEEEHPQILGQDWFMLVLEISIGFVITGILALVGIMLATRKRRHVARLMKTVDHTYEEHKKYPSKAIEELKYLKRDFENDYSAGKIEENQFLILDKKITEYIAKLKESETEERVDSVEAEHLPSPLETEIKRALEDGHITALEANDLEQKIDGSDLPEPKKMELKEMVSKWRESDKDMPPPPPDAHPPPPDSNLQPDTPPVEDTPAPPDAPEAPQDDTPPADATDAPDDEETPVGAPPGPPPA